MSNLQPGLPSPFQKPAFPPTLEVGKLLHEVMPADRQLGDNVGPIYFTDTPPAEDITDPRFGNRVYQLQGEAIEPDTTEVLVVVAKSTAPALITTDKKRTITVIKGQVKGLVMRADGKIEEFPYMAEADIPGRPADHYGFELHEGDSYAIVNIHPEAGPAVYWDVSSPKYELSDEVESEAVAPRHDRALKDSGYIPEDIWQELGIETTHLTPMQLKALVAGAQALIQKSEAQTDQP